MIYNLKIRKPEKWSGVTSYSNTTKAFQPSLSRKTKRLNLGILSNNKSSTKEGFRTVGEELRAEYEIALGLEKGALTDMVHPNGELVSNYWKQYSLEVPAEGVVLDTDNPTDALAVILLKASGLVTGRGEKSAHAKFELYSEEESADTSNNTRNEKMKAFTYLSNMSFEEKLDYVISKGHKADSAKPSIIENIVGRDVENDPFAFNKWVLSGTYKKKVQLYRWVQAGIVKQVMSKFTYRDITLGVNLIQAIEFVDNIRHQETVQGIMGEYKYYLDNLTKVESKMQAETEEVKEKPIKDSIVKSDNTKETKETLTTVKKEIKETVKEKPLEQV